MSAQEPENRAGSSPQQFEKLIEVISRSQHAYRELIDSLDQALFTMSLQGEIRVANLRLSEILGAPFPDFIGHSLAEFVESPTLQEAERALPVLLERGVWSGTLPVKLRKDGTLRYFACWFQTVLDGDRVMSVTGWVRDITRQHESETRFADLFDSLREGILIVTPGGEILDANPALVRMLGYERKEDLLGRNIGEMYCNPEDRDGVVRQIESDGFVQDKELVLRRKDGKTIHCLTSSFVTRNARGQAIRYQGTMVDITERLEIEKRLHEEREFTRRLVDCFPDMIAVAGRDGRFTYVSERSREILGIPPQEFVGHAAGESGPAGSLAGLGQVLENVMSSRQSSGQTEFRAQHADGSRRTLRVTASPMFDAAGNNTGAVASVRDVTEAKIAEEQLVQKEKFAAMGQMLAGAAHELNNPLTAILGIGELIRDKFQDGPEGHQADLILQQARRAAAIVQSLLALSRRPAAERSRLNLADIVQEALHSPGDGLAEGKIQVEFSPPRDLPAIEGDRRQLRQVFLNLLKNSEQAISAARGTGTVRISFARAGPRVCVTIADDGPGISSEHLNKVFDPFFTTKRPGGGSGMGLTISLAILKEHGGAMEAESAPGSGAVFHVYLPAAEARAASSSPKPAARGASDLSGHSLLVVDDEEGIREIVSEGLRARGMKVDTAGSCEEALSRLGAASYEFLLCDFNLPGMSGEQFFEQMRGRGGDSAPRFVLMTGELMDTRRAEELRRRGAAILHKPFDLRKLAELLAGMLQTPPAGVG